MALADDEVGALATRRGEQADGGRLELDDELRPCGVCGLGPGPDVLDDAQSVGLRDDHGGDVVVDGDDRGTTGGRVHGQVVDGTVERVPVGADDRARGLVERAAEEHTLAAGRSTGHRHGLGDG